MFIDDDYYDNVDVVDHDDDDDDDESRYNTSGDFHFI